MRLPREILVRCSLSVICGWTMLAFAAPPKVLETVPANGAREVDPELKEFRVVFDQPMLPGGMSVVGEGPAFPKLVGKARWENDRTFVWSWQLQPGHDYWLSINSGRFTNFRNQSGEPAAPYPIAFRTGHHGQRGTQSLSRHPEAIAHLKRAIFEDYAYHDLRNVKWEERFAEFSPKLEAAASPREFAEIAAQLLAPAQDIHLLLKVGAETVPTFQRNAEWNVALSSLPRRIPGWHKHNPVISTGLFADGIGYVFIRSWPASTSELEPAFALLKQCGEAGRPLIVDVRANVGGAELTARQFGGCFVDKTVAYAKHVIRRDGKFGESQLRQLQPNKDQPLFTNRVALLAGQGTVSSSEAFVMMMKQSLKCTFLGDNTAGASGNPVAVELGNGVSVFIPSWKNMDLAGICLEGKGVAPDQKIKVTASDFAEGDPLLAAALALLRSNK